MLLALIALVTLGLSWELLAASPVSVFVRPGVALLVVLQMLAAGLMLAWRASAARDRQELASGLEFQRGLSSLAKECAALSDAGSHEALRASMLGLAGGLGATRFVVAEGSRAGRLSAWCDSREAAPLAGDDGDLCAELGGSALQEAAQDGEIVRLERVLALPLRTNGPVIGVLALFHEDKGRPWTDEQVRRATAVAQALSHGIQRVQDRREVDEAAAFTSAVLDSASGDVAVLDRQGVVVAVNETWTRTAAAGNPTVRATRGAPFLDAVTLPQESRAHLAAAIHTVLSSERPQAMVEYAWDGPRERGWSEVRIHRLNRREGGAVLTHLEITARKRAEAEVQRHLHELAHVRMMSGMGELAAAVAHELNQPLTAVLSNAQAARRMMAATAPPLGEVREILDDIIEQDKRAGEVIERVRRMLRKDQFDWAPLDLNALIHDVLCLLGNQAALEGVSVAPALTPGLPRVRGDRVQLQQVVINLLQNAIHASVANEAACRPAVSISTSVSAGIPGLTVRDSGRGIPGEHLDRIFDPFYTTKPDGLGVGLSISRSIVELHRGQLTAANHSTGGAEFSVTLPPEGAPS